MRYFIGILCLFLVFPVIAYDSIRQLPASTNGKIHFSSGSNITYYVNKDNNEDMIGNYLSGTYFHASFGYFQLNWSSVAEENVKIEGSTSNCLTGYGYRLGGKAKSVTQNGIDSVVGKIDFSYDNNNFVYYCLSDGKLHGKAYSKLIGFQDFEGISIDLNTMKNPINGTGTTSSLFVNENTKLFFQKREMKTMKQGDESVFYIWKTKK